MGFDEYSTAARLRDAVRRICVSIIDSERPRYRYGTVASISRAANTCTVYFDNDVANPVSVRMGSIQPFAVGQIVRVAGLSGDRYLDDVMGQSYQASGDDAWTIPTFQNSWVNYGSGWDVAGYRKDTEGFVILKGLVKSGGFGTIIFTLPAGYRPGANILFPSYSDTGAARVDVLPSGAVQQSTGGTGYLNLNGIRFLAEN